MVCGVVAFANNSADPLIETQDIVGEPIDLHMQMSLPILLRISNPLLQNILRLFYKLPMQINCIIWDSSSCIVLAENVIGSLLVVLIHLRRMTLPLFRQLMRSCPIPSFICLMRLYAMSISSSRDWVPAV